MYYIYQILGNFNYKPVNFVIKTLDNNNLNNILDQKNEKQYLASIHIFKGLNVKDKKLVFLIPASLYNPSINIEDIINNWGLNNSEYEIIKMPANGAYSIGSFDYTPDEIFFFLYIDMIKRLNQGDTVFIDINAGLNEYVNSLNDSISYAYVTLGLRNLNAEKNNHDLDVYKIISEPVMRDSNRPNYSIYIQTLRRKIFFSLPSKEALKPSSTIEGNPDIKKEFCSKFICEKFYKEINRKNIIIFNSIKMNTLSILIVDKNLISIEMKNKVLKCLNEIIKNYSEAFFQNMSTGIRESKIKMVEKIISFIMSLNMYLGFIDFLENRLEEIRNRQNNNIINIEKLEKLADDIYKNYKINIPLNLEFLQRDIYEFKNYYNRIKKQSETTKGNKNEGSAKRNFFAHSGLDYNTVKLLNDNEVEFVGKLDERKKWLLSLDK